MLTCFAPACKSADRDKQGKQRVAIVCKLWVGLSRAGDFPQWFNGQPNVLGGGAPWEAASVFPGDEVFLTALSQGDGDLTTITGGIQFQSNIPPGFYPGWPGTDGAFRGFDASTAVGSAVLVPPLDTGAVNQIKMPNVAGYVQSFDGHTAGAFYVEYIVNFNTFFTNQTGIGIARKAPDINFIFGGEFGAGDVNGGAVVDGGNLGSGFLLDVHALGNTHGLGANTDTTGTRLAVAILITAAPFNTFPYRASQLEPVSMTCLPCTPLVMKGDWPGRYG